jgi:hypothetical protein
MSHISHFNYLTGEGVSDSFAQAVQDAQVPITKRVARVERDRICITDGTDTDYYFHSTKQFVCMFGGGPLIKMMLMMSLQNVSSFRLFLCNSSFRLLTRMFDQLIVLES